VPVLAYSTYEPTAQLLDSLVELISNNKWVAVDGGAYQSSIITPAINGLVVPSMSFHPQDLLKHMQSKMVIALHKNNSLLEIWCSTSNPNHVGLPSDTNSDSTFIPSQFFIAMMRQAMKQLEVSTAQ
jgi:hypothetical protein